MQISPVLLSLRELIVALLLAGAECLRHNVSMIGKEFKYRQET